jgi:DNA-binding XRE family transcriptional regulator
MSRPPIPAEVLAARQAAGLTQTEAAVTIHCRLRAWQQWESGKRKMHPAFWELFSRKMNDALVVKLAAAMFPAIPADFKLPPRPQAEMSESEERFIRYAASLGMGRQEAIRAYMDIIKIC